MTLGTREEDQRVGKMRSRDVTRLAWSLCALSLVLTVLSVLLLALNYTHPRTHVYGFWPENTVLPISFSIIGAVIASRQSPRLAILCGSYYFCGGAPQWRVRYL